MDQENVLRLPGSEKGPREVSGHESKSAPVSMDMRFSDTESAESWIKAGFCQENMMRMKKKEN